MMNIKTLVAAAAFAATGSAFAMIGNPTATTDGGEMSVHLFSQSAEVTYQFDSGVLFKDFNLAALANATPSTTPYTWNTTLDTATDTAFASFLAVAGSASDLSFAFWGGDNSGVSAAQRSMISTIRVGGDVSGITNGNMVDSMNQMGNYLSAVNAKQGLVTNGSSFFTQAEGAGHYYVNDKPTMLNKWPVGNDGLVGTTLDVYSFVRSSTSSLGNATETKIGTFTVSQLNDTQYSVAFSTPSAVPEPTSMALALVGLGALGLIARRRAK